MNNGTDRDVALDILSDLTDINTSLVAINNHLYEPYIITQPTDATDVEVDDPVSFTVVAANVVEYKWQSKSATGNWANSQLDGYNTATLSFTMTEARYSISYRCRLYSANGSVVTTNVVNIYPPAET